MATFGINETHTTAEPFITVETRQNVVVGGRTVPSPLVSLAVGKHRFQLVVEDSDGNRSEPAIVDVNVTMPSLQDLRGRLGDLGRIIRPSS
ncbi:MAG TPA: hypothetical protein VF754_05130 [Pyrinomonadaceae bacterium]